MPGHAKDDIANNLVHNLTEAIDQRFEAVTCAASAFRSPDPQTGLVRADRVSRAAQEAKRYGAKAQQAAGEFSERLAAGTLDDAVLHVHQTISRAVVEAAREAQSASDMALELRREAEAVQNAPIEARGLLVLAAQENLPVETGWFEATRERITAAEQSVGWIMDAAIEAGHVALAAAVAWMDASIELTLANAALAALERRLETAAAAGVGLAETADVTPNGADPVKAADCQTNQIPTLDSVVAPSKNVNNSVEAGKEHNPGPLRHKNARTGVKAASPFAVVFPGQGI